jgi:DNA-binding PadR family transcriptional regulator
MKTNRTKYLILGLLTDGDLSGYEIKRIVDIRFSFFWNESYGQLYPQLKELQEKGLITSKADSENSSRGKILYSITDDGRSVLQKWLLEPAEKETVRFEILLKMYFSNQMNTEVISQQIAEFAQYHQKQLFILNQFQNELIKLNDPNSNHKDILQVISFGQKTYTAYLEWAQEAITYLKGRENYETKD